MNQEVDPHQTGRLAAPGPLCFNFWYISGLPMRWWSQRLFYLKNKFPFTMAKSPVKLCASGHLKYNSRQTSLSLWCPRSECEAGRGRDTGGTGTSVMLVRPCYPSWKLRRCDNQGSPDNWGETSVSFPRHTSRGLSFLLIPPPPLSSRLAATCHAPWIRHWTAGILSVCFRFPPFPEHAPFQIASPFRGGCWFVDLKLLQFSG